MSALGNENGFNDLGGGPPGDSSWVWAMPTTGMSWCDCGEGHELNREIIWSISHHLGLERRSELSYAELFDLAMEVWRYDVVCRFFKLSFDDAIDRVYGRHARRYPMASALDIIGYFSKRWQGCPELDCGDLL
ncbi:hypothetical protein [Glutamicibacter sp. NPDC087344]|uniref:hypothetical protein n=1 Tax=Glutamicibacter sp. NPDC087344 TaxID=3363994 RepID=UPI003816D561